MKRIVLLLLTILMFSCESTDDLVTQQDLAKMEINEFLENHNEYDLVSKFNSNNIYITDSTYYSKIEDTSLEYLAFKRGSNSVNSLNRIKLLMDDVSINSFNNAIHPHVKFDHNDNFIYIYRGDLDIRDVNSLAAKNESDGDGTADDCDRRDVYNVTTYENGEEEWEYLYSFCANGSGGNGQDEESDSEDGGSNSGGENPEEDVFIIDLQNTTAIDIVEALKCFDLSVPAKFTIYVQQPRENSSEVVGPNSVGHAFIGIEQNGIIRNFGFYPESGSNSAMVGVGVSYNSEIRSNDNYLYHVSASRNITSGQLTLITNYSKNAPEEYDVNEFACADFAINAANLAGLNLPSTTVNYFSFSGRSPGVLGQEIRAMNSNGVTTINKTSGTSPSKSGNCN